MKKTNTLSRRRFLAAMAATGMSITVVPRHVLGQAAGQQAPSDKLRIAGIGVGGRGANDISEVSGESLVALCDVDDSKAADTFKKFPNASRYKDFRVMLDKEADNIDAVVIGTPDHIHAPAAMRAILMKKHVYCEKPLTHTIYEARALTQAARKYGVVTQMGNQGHAGEGIRLTYEFIKDGAIGTVREVHGWSDRPQGWWPQGIDRPAEAMPIPKNLDWDLWLGPAPQRPYHDCYVPFKWRGWMDFGTGAMGDMAVHNLDPAFFCLNLTSPDWVEAQTDTMHKETWPNWQMLTYHFPKTDKHPEILMKWFDGGKFPPRPEEFEESRKMDGNGILFIGDKGKIICGSHAGAPRLLPESKMKEYKRPEKTLQRSPGHHKEWIEACKRGDPTGAWSNFGYSGPFTESLLVANLAVILQKRITWDARTLKATNAPEADILINKSYRKGFELGYKVEF